ncbi:MAG TPA: ASPIC/UnbV domain-containing protein, partial [Vicinamibacterales bacterium]|nr:ASPIC/UnbV domain-containing protein [Vicinamibacterales bacterium]
HALRLFENPGNGNDWINIRLVGVKPPRGSGRGSNRAAIGARLTVHVESAPEGGTRAMRALHRTIGSGGSFGANPMEQHVGLGANATDVSIDVWWPASNTRQHFANVQKNQFLEITEFAKDYARVERKAVRLGGSK